MENMNNIRAVLHEYFKAKTDNPFAGDDNLFNAGLLDSMGVLDLVYHIEEKMGVQIDPEDISEENFKTIDAIASLTERLLR